MSAASGDLLARAGVGVQHTPTGRHPIEILTRQSTSTAVAVRTHVPVLIEGRSVLIPIGDADRIMRSIASQVWPADPSPMEEAGYCAGAESAARAWVELSDLRHEVEFRRAQERHARRRAAWAEESAFQARAYRVRAERRIAEGVEILETFAEDDEARQAALQKLKGGSL